ncbi:MAG: FAD:protein FMN transferase [Bacteroidota bacterium]
MSVVKEMFSRKRILPLLLGLVIVVFWFYKRPAPMVEIEGITFGTIVYHIKYKDTQKRNFKNSVDSLLVVFNNALSHYIPDSELSRFNRGSSPQKYESPFILPVLEESKRIYDLSEGAYNPAVMPLVNVWGFGPAEGIQPDSLTIDSLLQFTDFNLVEYDLQEFRKNDSRVQLDFSASAKGYGIDVVAHFLKARGIENYFIEIGGEVICAGVNAQNRPWRIGILDPDSDFLNQSLFAEVDVENMAVATSANNFNYRIIDGIKYSHTIDPTTGYPTTRTILSASIFTKECITADALATACMVIGVEESKEMVDKMDGVEALLIYSDEKGGISTYVTDGISTKVTFNKK